MKKLLAISVAAALSMSQAVYAEWSIVGLGTLGKL